MDIAKLYVRPAPDPVPIPREFADRCHPLIGTACFPRGRYRPVERRFENAVDEARSIMERTYVDHPDFMHAFDFLVRARAADPVFDREVTVVGDPFEQRHGLRSTQRVFIHFDDGTGLMHDMASWSTSGSQWIMRTIAEAGIVAGATIRIRGRWDYDMKGPCGWSVATKGRHPFGVPQNR